MIHDLIMFLAWGEKPRIIDCNSIALAVPAALFIGMICARKGAS